MTERGMMLGGRYELDQVIGRGGMAEVWRARDTRLVRDVAVKRLRIDLASDPTFQARFRREAQSAAGLNHPNIVSVYDTGEELDTKSDVSIPYIVMELVEGVTLRDVLRDGRKIVPERALEFTAGVLDGLSYAHRAGIVHRDIKPANVMLTPAGSVKVMDFGIARAVADTSATMTQTAAVIGTAQYLSPEQARGEKVDNRSDLYSVGCLLYELLVSQPPFTGDSPVSVAYQHVRENPVPPSQLDPEITPAMDAIVLKALAKDPAERYQDAREMRDDIMRALNHEPVHAVTPDPAAEQTTALIPGAAPVPTPAMASSGVTPLPAPVASPARPAEPERRSRKGLIALLVLAALVLIGMITAVAMLLNPSEQKVEQVSVPRVQGIPEVQARNEIINAKLQPKVTFTKGTEEDKGTVVTQSPNGGTMVDVNSIVTLTVSQGPDMGTIPDNLVTMTKADAEAALRKAGFTKVSFSDADPREEPITAKPGTVTATDPGPGTKLALDKEVKLTIATGRSVVPTLRGRLPDEARQTALEAGFELRLQTVQIDEQPAGVIFDQDPSPGELMERGKPILVKVAEPKPAPEPPVSPPPAPPTNEPTAPEPPAPSATTNPPKDPTPPVQSSSPPPSTTGKPGTPTQTATATP